MLNPDHRTHICLSLLDPGMLWNESIAYPNMLRAYSYFTPDMFKIISIVKVVLFGVGEATGFLLLWALLAASK